MKHFFSFVFCGAELMFVSSARRNFEVWLPGKCAVLLPGDGTMLHGVTMVYSLVLV